MLGGHGECEGSQRAEIGAANSRNERQCSSYGGRIPIVTRPADEINMVCKDESTFSIEPRYSESDRIEEERRIRHLRHLVDFSMALIAQSRLTLLEAQLIVQAVREQACRLFPGKEKTFELIYTPRFRRLISERFGLQ